jgi:hypothetical protein
VDYKELLSKYIEHVLDNEGVDFIGHGISFNDVIFTKEEWIELEKISKEVSEKAE